ncbi:GCN5-like N-acetyltransferase [Halosimplex carlsbadense 2-9-1]|uniref:GCN5-like N-acetyltransferase n=1 Tax=Halosimplex carlsbadense 2-9-1 TaxID=797114 RepID=M0CQI7_9EURY|nr:GNAT family N-acetyltransferase [Halosimplex carlsbadense]ELZ24149.1 GCN5-like N-acetyltransferase [Halosimplex carlsbadense 2-9-1]
MELVEATREDVATLAEYWYALATEMEQYDELNEVAYDDAEPAEDGFEGLLDGEDTTVYLLEPAEESIGLLVLREGDHPSRTHSAYLDIVDLYVAPEHRASGHGSDAIDAVERIARDLGADYVEVSCEWHNDGARRFYEDNGFEPKQVTYTRRVD